MAEVSPRTFPIAAPIVTAIWIGPLFVLWLMAMVKILRLGNVIPLTLE